MDFERIGKYKVVGKIGEGAMGQVYKAHDPILNRFVAIKTMLASVGSDEELRKRFHREAQSAAGLNHPNIITVYDFGEEQGVAYMAMELLVGHDLRSVIGNLAVTLDEKMSIMEQICDGLTFAHAMEIVHRDLKPANIHVQPNGQVKIMDFGLARLGASDMTRTGMVMGTPNYMSPEQVRGEKVDARSDIFSVGAVFYELLTVHKPFFADSTHAVLFQVAREGPRAAPPLGSGAAAPARRRSSTGRCARTRTSALAMPARCSTPSGARARRSRRRPRCWRSPRPTGRLRRSRPRPPAPSLRAAPGGHDGHLTGPAEPRPTPGLVPYPPR